MAKFNIDMLGAPELSTALAALPDTLERKVMVQATKKAAQFFLTAAQGRAPVSADPRDKHRGKLKSTMKLTAMKRSRRRVGYLVQTGTRAELGIPSGVNPRTGKPYGYYPAHLEFGTQKQAPNPYMRSALQGAHEALLAILRQEIDNGIERAMQQAGL